ncbi:TetR/AcrR family transcriptional regulator [Novosphingobium sp.]|uniref:TetR/AcrR family transcriptional regulator n=1 Tax=Novosphingobium sp. TaxID=1874826 RepID=UPI003BAA062C
MTVQQSSKARRIPTRDRLIAAAFTVVARDGLANASVKTIAGEAGVAPGLLHYHFPTRTALLEAALRRGLDEYLAASRLRRAATSPERQIDAFFTAAQSLAADDRELIRVRLAFAAAALSDHDLRVVLQSLNAEAQRETAMVFANARGANEPDAKELALAATIKAAFDGIMLAWLNDPGFPLAVAGRTLEQAMRVALTA